MGGGGTGSTGGGAIKLIVSGTLTVNGRLSANAGNAGGITGAGGSVWVTGGGTLGGTGEIQAVQGSTGNASGGGGRISIDDTMGYAFQGNLRAGGPRYNSTPGTLYLPAAARQNFTIDTNQTFVIGSGTNYTFGDLTVKGILDCGADTLGYGTGIVIIANNITIPSNGVIKADSRGFFRNLGPGAPLNTQTNWGATHAGTGYLNSASAIYGSATQPNSIGSGAYGANTSEGGNAFWGGGAIKLVVANTLTVNGRLSANGGAKGAAYGGSAGGSIWIDCGTLLGSNGVIQANGGGSASTNYGGGGRISIKYRGKGFVGLPAPGTYVNMDTNLSTTITVRGGYNVGTNGVEDGSIYIQSVPQGSVVFFQ